MAIKPSGIPYNRLTSDSIVIVGIASGHILISEFSRAPSVDTPIHLEIYRRFPEVGGIAHTHSPYATAFAQAGQPIPCCGTTHADAFFGEVPVTRILTEQEVEGDYERNIGVLIASMLKPDAIPAILMNGHGPFTVGKTAQEAVDNALILEKVAMLALVGLQPLYLPSYLQKKHFLRKHGQAASYGQL
ncbi:MAG: L-ribulose 5-phosphate 4-epimerase [Parcubacteria group bacterium Gr01-1014_17]|nr:MAG: L-ribulose 5-phosphate 4-epimerase [Parcubacteria group bacterium Gr01-1014_17]